MSKAGKLDRRITIERYTATQDAFGGDVEAWTALTTIYAQRTDTSSKERIASQQVNATVDTRFKFRFSSVTKTVTAKDRILFDGDHYDINGSPRETKEGRSRFLEVDASRQAD